jgi:hypothetical protein
MVFPDVVPGRHVRYDLLATEDWEEWQQNLAHFFSKPYVRGYWPTVAGRYARSFRAFGDVPIAKGSPKEPRPDAPEVSANRGESSRA